MADTEFPVELTNPGQVLACLGFLEAAEMLLGDAEGGFEWTDEDARFHIRAAGDDNPVEVVLAFLAETEIRRFGPVGYVDPPPKKKTEATGDSEGDDDDELASGRETGGSTIELTEVFPAGSGDRMALPIRFGGGNRPIIELGHWADASGRESFKLYSGNRSAEKIARAMLKGVRRKPSKAHKRKGQWGDLKTKGLVQLWEEERARLIKEPFHVLTPMGGSFNFDPRGAWTAIDAGYSPNEHKHSVEASPVVEFLAAWGLEHARPIVSNGGLVRYAVWMAPLPPVLARAAFVGGIPSMPMKRLRFTLDSSGKNRIVTFAEQETQSWVNR